MDDIFSVWNIKYMISNYENLKGFVCFWKIKWNLSLFLEEIWNVVYD